MSELGKYVVIEGHDGTGKSKQVELLHERLEKSGIEAIEVHEPAGVPIADELRKVIKNGELDRDGTTNLLLFTAARRELWRQAIAPSLGKGAWVLAARNWISTVAYQGYGEGLDPEEIRKVTADFTDPAYLTPDHTFVLDLSDETERARRIAERGALEQPDTFESRDTEFQARVKQGYLSVAKKHGFPILDASGTLQEVKNDIWSQLKIDN